MDGVFNIKTTSGDTLIMKCNFESLQKSENITFIFNEKEVSVAFRDIRKVVETIHQIR